jgi:hypothetical protein
VASAGRATGAAKALARAKAGGKPHGGGDCGTGAGGFKTHNTCGQASRGTPGQRSGLAGHLKEARAGVKAQAAQARPGDVGAARRAERARGELAGAARAGRAAPDPIVKGRSREIPVKGDLAADPRYGRLKSHIEKVAVEVATDANAGDPAAPYRRREGVRLDRNHELVVDAPRTRRERALVEKAAAKGAVVVETAYRPDLEARREAGRTDHLVGGKQVATAYHEPRADGRYLTRTRPMIGDDWREHAHDTREDAARWAKEHAAGVQDLNSHNTLDAFKDPRAFFAEDRISKDEHSRTTFRILHRG